VGAVQGRDRDQVEQGQENVDAHAEVGQLHEARVGKAQAQHYGEDRDFCNRVMYHGLKISVVLNASICHDRIYQIDNIYRKDKNLLFSISLSQLKNINHSLFFTYSLWILKRIKRITKWLLMLKLKFVLIEIISIGQMIMLLNKINKSRKISKSTITPFLNQFSQI